MNKLIERNQPLIFSALVNKRHPNYWSDGLVRKYLRDLNTKFPDIKVSAKGDELHGNILDWITNADPELTSFLYFNQLSEAERSRVVELLTIPETMQAQIEKLINKFEPVEYDAYNHGSWASPKIIYAQKEDESIEIWLAVGGDRSQSESFVSSQEMSDSTIAELLEKVQTKNPDATNIEKIQLVYSAFTRIVNIIKIDTSTNQISVSTDDIKVSVPRSEEEKYSTIKPEQKFEEILNTTFEKIGVSATEDLVTDIRKEKRINKDSVMRIKTLDKDDMLLLPYKFIIKRENAELSSRNTSNYYEIEPLKLLAIVQDYLKENGTFSNFLINNDRYDAQKDAMLAAIKNVDKTEAIGEGFIIFLLNSEKKVDYGKITCNIATGSAKVVQGRRGSDIHGELNRKLDQLFQD